MRLEFIGGHKPARLPDNGAERAGIQFPMRGNRQYLTPGPGISDELDVAAVLPGDIKPETAEDTDDPPESLRSFCIRRLHLDRHEQRRRLSQAEVSGVFAIKVEGDSPAQVLDGLIDGSALRDHRDFQALTNETGLIASANRRGDVLAQLRHRNSLDNCSPHADEPNADSGGGRAAAAGGGGSRT